MLLALSANSAPSVDWLDLLPAPFNQDPVVVVVMAPNSALRKEMESLDSSVYLTILELESTKKQTGLQITQPVIGDWEEQRDQFDKYGYEIAKPSYVGRLSAIPHKLLMYDSICPLVFIRAKMSEPYLNLKSYFLTKVKKLGGAN